MKNKYIIKFFLIFFFILSNHIFLHANEEFSFDITEIEITNDGNFFKGLKRGKATTNNGQIIIIADNFEYNKITNILIGQGNVEIIDKIKNYSINSNHITYEKKKEKIFSKGRTNAFVKSKYKIVSSDVNLDLISNILVTKNKAIIIDDKFTQYETGDLYYSINENIFKGNNIVVLENTDKEINELNTYKFKNGIFDLKKKEFFASDTKIYAKKNTFDNEKNDPRIYGVSSSKKNRLTNIKKAFFTSCKLNDKCPPWSIKASEIFHDQDSKDISYNNSILKIYDFPIFYFPRFSHPDPSVERRSGFIQPQLNKSNILGSSLYLPYFHTLATNKDITFKPTIFDSEIYMMQTEYREVNKDNRLIAQLGITKGYQNVNETRDNIGNIFAKFTSKLNLKNFIDSELDLSIKKVTKDTFLKVFDTSLIDVNKNIKPTNQNQLSSHIKLNLNHKKYDLGTGFISYEKLTGSNSDRFQYILPYYNLSSNIYHTNLFNLEFSSDGSNSLKETNKLRSVINNNFTINSKKFISNIGLVNSFNILFKNLNTVGKNDENLKSSPQSELMNIINLESTFPLIKLNDRFRDTLTPRVSLRLNPNNKNDSSNLDRSLDVNNIFSINRLGLSESFEEGKSLTLGVNYKKETMSDINKYFELKLAGVLRDVEQNKIPTKTSINQTTSNLFGSTVFNFSENIKLDYNFSIDNDLETFEYNNVGLNINFDKISTSINFTEKDGKMGDVNTLQNSITMNFNEDSYLTFNTRRNRKINFTEYYDLVYEYKNDCLIAGVKYKKSYYEDRDLKPTEDLLFTITLFPLTQYEQKIDQNAFR